MMTRWHHTSIASLAVWAACWFVPGDLTIAGAWTAEAPAKDDKGAKPLAEPTVPDAVRDLLQDRKYAEAVKAIDAILSEPAERTGEVKRAAADRDWLAYLKARALHLATKYDAAVATFEQAEEQFPDSRWQRHYRFGRAAALARKGDFQAAEKIYRQEAAGLLSVERKQEIADIYLEFANAYFKPADENQSPDYTKALEFFNQALAVGPRAEKRAEVELLVARCYQALGNLPEAANRYAQFSKDHAGSPLDLEARYRLGETRLAQGQREEARRTWQDLLAAYVNSEDDRIAEAMFHLSETYGLPSPDSTEDLELGVASLDQFLKRFPDHRLAGQAFLRIANSQIHCDRFAEAAKTLVRFLEDERYAERDELPDARVLLGRSYQLQKKFDEALDVWRQYLVQHPAHSSWTDVQRAIVDTEFVLGAEARQAKRYDQARQLWQAFMAKYPLDRRNPRIMLEFGSMHFQEEEWNEAIADWRRLVSKYPGSEPASQAQFLIAATLEEKLGRLDDALKEYRKVTWGKFSAQARGRVERLTATELTIATERVFRTNETPRVKLTSRNLASVNVRVYTVDLETYFRKMHLAGGVEGLDVALIDPDRRFDFEVPKYAQYQQFDSEIEVPLSEVEDEAALPGVIVVTVSGKTLEATTLVVRSDLDIIVKSSRDEVFVFAENLRTGEPWPKAHLLISNGQQVFAETDTGDDGVFHSTYDELKAAGNVRVFAIATGNVASNVVGLQGIGVATGLTERGYIFTDRPAYRAGQLVHVRGVVRTVADDRFTVPDGKKYHLEVFDSRNRLIRQDEVSLGKFGSFHAHFALPGTAALGNYRIQVRDDDGHSYQGAFQVHEYRLDPVRLGVDTERKVFYRGEEISGKITAKFYYGAPVADREIRYQLAGGRVYTGRTDDRGELAFKLPTRDFRESQTLPLVVTLAERNLQATVNFYLAVRGFSIGVTTVRPVFVSGETFEATVTTRDAEGKPVGEKLTLRVLERTTVEGRSGEREVESHEVTTDEKDGTARVTLRLEEGARYILRAEGTDRFENPVSGSHTVTVSDDNDRVRLRILADRHTYRVGDTAQLKLHWREKPALALITFDGARVLDYRLVRLKTGANELEIPMTAALAPNFELAAAVMTDARAAADAKPDDAKPGTLRRFHTASSPFTVERALTVAIATTRQGQGRQAGEGPARPGDKIDVTITTTDPQGKPVEAELSLALIEQALWEMFGANVPAIDEFFKGQPRASAMRSESSVTFAYHPHTRPINPLLLAEKDRREIEAEEAERMKQLAVFQTEEETRARMDGGQKLADSKNGRKSEQQRQMGLNWTVPSGDRLRRAAHSGKAGDTDADFKELVDTITSSAAPTTWDDVGGEGTVSEYPQSLSMSISQDQIVIQEEDEALLDDSANEPYDIDNEVDGPFPTDDAFDQVRFPRGGVTMEKMQPRGDVTTGLSPGGMGGAGFGDRDSGGLLIGGRGLPGEEKANRVADGSKLITESTAFHDRGEVLYSSDLDIEFNQSVHGRFADDAPQAEHFGWFAAPSRESLLQGAANGSVAVMLSDGSVNNLAFDGKFDKQKAEQVAEDLRATGAVLLPPAGSQETAYWNPAIVTDAKGQATVTITLPERTTAWKLLAKGITVDTLAGEGEAELIAKKELFGELKLPLAFTDGDEAEIEVTIHDAASDEPSEKKAGAKEAEDDKADDVKSRAIEVTLKTTIGGKTVEETRMIRAGDQRVLNFKTKLDWPAEEKNPPEKDADAKDEAADRAAGETVTFELVVRSGDLRDVVRRTLPLEPYGLPVYAAASGSATSDTTVWVEPPADMPLESPRLEVIVGPNVEQSLLDALLAPPHACGLDLLRLASGLDTTTSDLLAALALEKLMADSRQAGTPRAESLDLRVRSSLSLLISSQNDDGGWSWTGRNGASDRLSSARVLWALSLARQAGYRVADDGFEKAVGFVSGQVAATAETDFESKAVLLQALSAAGRGDFALANRLYRNRPSLSPTALAHLALALTDMDRAPMAKDLLDLLAKRNLDAPKPGDIKDRAAPVRFSTRGMLGSGGAAAELRALYLLALEKVSPDSPKAKELADWLMAHRLGHRWSPDRATGPAVLALGDWFGRARFDDEHYQLTVIVNNIEVGQLDITKDSRTQTLAVPPGALKKDKQQVRFQLAGRGRFTFQCVLGGFVPADKLKSTTRNWTVRRHYEPAPRELDGEPVPRGFNVLQGAFTAFRNPLTQLPVAARGHVRLDIARQNVPANTPEEDLEYLVVTEPLPSGVTVIEQSVQGGFERFEIGAGQIVFYVGSRQHVAPIEFDVHGYLPGDYRAGPTAVRNAYRPEQLAVSGPHALTVLPLGKVGGDEYKWSPDELLELGKRHFAKGNLAAAGGYLAELVAKWQLKPEIHREAATMLLDVHLALGPEADIVRYFELIKEKWPDVELSFEKIVRVGAAYEELGEYERGYLVFRATVESSFLRESGVAGFLEAQGEFTRSVDVMSRLLAEYPPEPYTAAAQYALAQRVYAYAPQAAGDTSPTRQRGEETAAKITRVDLVERAMRMLDGFLTAYPDDPAADQASFSLANALLELKAYAKAIARCRRYAERYPKSDFLDSYWYIIGYSHFALGEHEEALEMCRKVAEAKRVDPQTGHEDESRNKWRAIYILAQVYHSLGKAADAIREYTRVEERFADARQAIDYFTHKAIELPEVTTFEPDGRVKVELKFRNIARCDTRVYKIDLMKFSLLKRNLSNITSINLAGIRPYFEAVIELGDGKDYRDRVRELPLPLKDEGAYLVVCRGDDLHASGLVLVTPLKVEVREEASSGEVRTTVKNVTKDTYVPEVRVKVIGTRNGDFVSGETDLRGVFVAQSIQGTSTVIAEGDDNRYAFFRGHTELGPAPPAPAPNQAHVFGGTPAEPSAKPAAGQMEQLLEGLNESNSAIQQMQGENLKSLYKNESKGVKAKDAF